MILFLNFAPFSFAGGAERWMIDVATAIGKKEKTVLIDVDRSLANIYGSLVLKRKYNQRLNIDKNNKDSDFLTLNLFSFIPYTAAWKKAKSKFSSARIVYFRYEISEIIILLYFGGLNILNKSVAGIHSPFIYSKPVTFLDRIHNFFYASFLSKFFMNKLRIIHIVNAQDAVFFKQNFALKNVVFVPNFLKLDGKFKNIKKNTKGNNLKIIFVGELNLRKGIDILLEVIKHSPQNFEFCIVGDGPMKRNLTELENNSNVKYYGYLQKDQVTQLYQKNDVLFMPSRAESFPLVSLEAIYYGLPIVSSPQTDMNFPKNVQLINSAETIDGYIKIFNKLNKEKKSGKLKSQKNDLKQFVRKNFSLEVVLPKLFKEVFDLG